MSGPITRAGCASLTFGKGEVIELPIAQMLKWLGVGMESQKGTRDGALAPPLRLIGEHISVDLGYYNFHQAPVEGGEAEEEFTFDAGDVVCVAELSVRQHGDPLGGRIGASSTPA